MKLRNINAMLFAGILVAAGGGANAEASPIEACSYFDKMANIDSDAEFVNVEAPILVEPYTRSSIALDRYSIFTRSIQAEVGWLKDDGTQLISGALSALFTCEVDVIDRRVLRISVSPGPLAGEEIELSDGSKRTALTPGTTSVEIGAMSHQGKY
jgi:hypothetical protein